jgi:hypothetical protein
MIVDDIMTRHDKFELKYAAYTGVDPDEVKACRLSNGSYNLPKIASAFYWYETAYIQGKLDREYEDIMRSVKGE